MSFDPQVITAATEQLERQKNQRHKREYEALQLAYCRDPSLPELDKEIRKNMALLVGAAIRKDAPLSPEAIRENNKKLQRERSQRLIQLQIDPSSVADTPDCSLCGDSGWIGRNMCQCLKTLCTNQQLSQLSSLLNLGNADFSLFRLEYYNTIITLPQNISPRDNMSQIYSICYNYAKEFRQFPYKNLFLSGDSGLGKTFLSACIGRMVAELGHSVVYVTANKLFEHFNIKQFPKGHYEEDIDNALENIRRYFRCELLIIDDLGTEVGSGPMRSAFYELVNQRLVEGQHTIMSTNYPMHELTTRYSGSTLSRLEGDYYTLHFFGDDIRKLKKENVFFQ